MNQKQLQELIDKVGFSELEAAIKARKNKLTYMNVFKGIKIEFEDIEQINREYHVITNPYVDLNNYRSPYSRKGYIDHWRGLTHDSLGITDPHMAIKMHSFTLLRAFKFISH